MCAFKHTAVMRLSLHTNKNTSTQDEKDYFVYLDGTVFMSQYFKKNTDREEGKKKRG